MKFRRLAGRSQRIRSHQCGGSAQGRKLRRRLPHCSTALRMARPRRCCGWWKRMWARKFFAKARMPIWKSTPTETRQRRTFEPEGGDVGETDRRHHGGLHAAAGSASGYVSENRMRREGRPERTAQEEGADHASHVLAGALFCGRRKAHRGIA